MENRWTDKQTNKQTDMTDYEGTYNYLKSSLFYSNFFNTFSNSQYVSLNTIQLSMPCWRSGYSELDMGRSAFAIFLDLSKAFYTPNHDSLI